MAIERPLGDVKTLDYAPGIRLDRAIAIRTYSARRADE
jgi:hypothetical protein